MRAPCVHVPFGSVHLPFCARSPLAPLALWPDGDTGEVTCTDPPALLAHKPPNRGLFLSAGEPRRASTFLFIALQTVLRRVDPLLVAGWYVDLMAFQKKYGRTAEWIKDGAPISALQAYTLANCTTLVKIHTLRDYALFSSEDADDSDGPAMEIEDNPMVAGVFASYRDLRAQTRSIIRMGWGHASSESAIAHTRAKLGWLWRWSTTRIGEKEAADPRMWVLAARGLARCHSQLRASAGRKLLLEIRAEDLTPRAYPHVLAQLGGALGIAADLDWNDLAAELTSLVQPLPCNSPLAVHPLTGMHRAHVEPYAPPSAAEEAGMRAIWADPVCRAWLEAHGYGEDMPRK